MNNKHTVLGSEGLIGTHLRDYIVNQVGNCHGMDVKTSSDADLRHAKIPELLSYDYVYFLAWNVGGAKYLYDPDTQYKQLEWNVEMLVNVMKQLRNYTGKVVFVSSQLAEDTELIYGLTKKLGEKWAEMLGFTTIRLWNVYGWEPMHPKSHVISDFVSQAIGGEINMMTNGEERRQFIYVKDAVKAMYQIATTAPPGHYDLTSNEWMSIKRVAGIVANQTGALVNVGNDKGRECVYEPTNLYPFEFEHNLEQGIEDVIRDCREFQG